MTKKKLPKKLYVYREEGSGEDWLQPEESLRDCATLEDSRVVGVYELVSTVSVQTNIVEKKLAG